MFYRALTHVMWPQQQVLLRATRGGACNASQIKPNRLASILEWTNSVVDRGADSSRGRGVIF